MATVKPTGAPVKAAPKSFARRDELIDIQNKMQQRWAAEKAFEVDVPEDTTTPKYFSTFPYPYMNGRLHLGHTFTASRCDFITGFQRMKGKAALWPFGLHCTGMPIKACADKLRREIAKFGCPPVFPEEPEEEPVKKEEKVETAPAEGGAFHAKKTKAASKSGKESYQWNIMASMNVPLEEIPKFQDPTYWIKYFPELGLEDLKLMGAKVDYRRSFVTTDVNPYYDRFVRWQFNTLKKLNKVEKGFRYCIWSPADGQQCGDHDRKTGEGVAPQEYTGIKMQVTQYTEALKEFESCGKKLFFVAATLRPETMYGQTNFFVLPTGDYGVYETNKEDELFIMGEHAARNMAFQKLSKIPAQTSCLKKVTGDQLIGAGVKSPNAVYDTVYCLPMFGISMTKGTAVVTSVPSDAPDDYAALMDVKNKAAMRQKFGIKDEWVMPYEVVPIIDIPEWGNTAAVVACQKFKVASQNDKEQLLAAKKAVYKDGFYSGTMIVGPHAGQGVAEAKPLIREELLKAGLAIRYCEPEKEVISRTDDICVVSESEQWSLVYGEESWKAQAEECLAGMELYHSDTRTNFEVSINWLKEWACSREFGLGTRLPFDEKYLIESLSDSTIYMAYYTIVHKLQGGVIDGSVVGPSGIKAEQLTDAVFDYIFLEGAYPADCGIKEEILADFRKEFNYWYPFDLRVSGKDLIQNHLTMSIYNHVAMFPKEKWPKSFRCNGYVLRDNEKMSKSVGNFLTLKDAVELYSADGMRMGLASAGDGTDDANFVDDAANGAIMRLHTFLGWSKEVVAGTVGTRSGPATQFWDKVFEAQINKAIQESGDNYERLMFRDAYLSAFIDFQNARDTYRTYTKEIGMNRDLLQRFVEVQCLLMSPIAPHTADYIWTEVLKNEKSIVFARWPEQSAAGVDIQLLRQAKYLDDFLHAQRKKLDALSQPKKPKKGGAPEPAPARPSIVYLYTATEYPKWQQATLMTLRKLYEEGNKTLPDDKSMIASFKAHPDLEGPVFKNVMPFVAMVKEDLKERGLDALDLALPFDEQALLNDNIDFIKNDLQLQKLLVFGANSENIIDPQKKRDAGVPGKPAATYLTEEEPTTA